MANGHCNGHCIGYIANTTTLNIWTTLDRSQSLFYFVPQSHSQAGSTRQPASCKLSEAGLGPDMIMKLTMELLI